MFWKIHFHLFSNNPRSLKSKITLLCSCRHQTVVYTFNVLLMIVLPSIVILLDHFCMCLYILYITDYFSKTFLWIKIIEKSRKWLYIIFKKVFFRSKNCIWIKKLWKLVRNLNEYFRTRFRFSISISSWIPISKLSYDISCNC